jgi:hypothetical protein
MSTSYAKGWLTAEEQQAAAAQAVVMSPYVKDEFKEDIKAAVAAQHGDPEIEAKENLFTWLKWSGKLGIYGPNSGWPSFCNKPIEEWDDWLRAKRFKEDSLQAAKAAYDKYHNLTGGKRRKRTKFNKRKSSSRVLSKSRRRTHRK